MRKTQVALAAIALVASTAAMANGVTVSGYVDAGLANQSGSGTKMIGGLANINQINFAGSEDLGGGLKAEFFLQSRFEVPSGLLTSQAKSGSNVTNVGLFNQSYIGLSSEAGTIQLGRGVDAFWGNAAAAFDVTGGNNMGSFVGSVINKGASGVFVDNQIKYISPNLGGLNAAVSYITQDSALCAVGSCKKGDYSVGATYGMGALSLGLGYANRASGNTVSGTATFFGAGYDLGIAKVNLVYVDTKNLGSTLGVNTSAPISAIAGLSINAGYYSDTATAGNGTSTAVGAAYALSKRTNVFANYQTTTGAYKTFTGLSDGGLAGAAAKSAFTLGVGHSF